MDSEELKAALLDETPEILTDGYGQELEYKCVDAIIYRKKNGRIDVSAQLLDYCGRSVITCDPKKLRKKGDSECLT